MSVYQHLSSMLHGDPAGPAISSATSSAFAGKKKGRQSEKKKVQQKKGRQ
jgi:hypothetical protein